MTTQIFHREEVWSQAGRGKRLTSSTKDSDRLRGPPSLPLTGNRGGGDFYAVVKRPQREADHLPPSGGEVVNKWRYTSTLLHYFTALTGTILPVLPTLKKVVVCFNVQALSSVSQLFWDLGPVNSCFTRRGPGPNKFTRKYLSNFVLSSYIKPT